MMCVPSRFAVLRDPADWLSVNSFKGNVTTKAILDRESPHVHHNQYTALFIATDNGKKFCTWRSYVILKLLL